MNPDASRKKTLTLVGLALLAVVVVVGLVLLLLNKTSSEQYQVLVDPPDAVLTIDGVPAQPGTVTLTGGEHILKATRDLFEDAVVVVNTKDLIPGQEIFVIPKAVSPEALKYLEGLSDDTGISEKIGAAVVAERNAIVAEKYPITSKLPYNSLDYRVDYVAQEDLSVSFTVILYPFAKPDNPSARTKQLKEFKGAALRFLQENGVDINTAKITYDPADAANL